jgi:hypothetical protein
MTTTPSHLSATSKLRWAGIACALVGIAMFFYGGLSFMKSMTQVELAAKQDRAAYEKNAAAAGNPVLSEATKKQVEQIMSLASSMHQLALTNCRLKIAIIGLSVLLAGAGGIIWFTSQRR